MPERRYDVDWLRIIAMLAVFLYHCTRFFDPEGWHLKNTEQSELLFVLMRGLIWTWVMELLLNTCTAKINAFLASGWLTI